MLSFGRASIFTDQKLIQFESLSSRAESSFSEMRACVRAKLISSVRLKSFLLARLLQPSRINLRNLHEMNSAPNKSLNSLSRRIVSLTASAHPLPRNKLNLNANFLTD